jgi:hypothetical protein
VYFALPSAIFFMRMPPCNVDFADVTVTFSLPHQQKSQQRGVKQICQQYARGHSIFFFTGDKTKQA